jgi:hypothetical protein
MLQQQAAQLELVEGLQKQVSALLEKSTSTQTVGVVPEHLVDKSEKPEVVVSRRKAKQVTEVTTTTKVTSEVDEVEIKIIPWSDESPLRVTTEQMGEAFARNPVLREYASFNAAEMTDPKKAPPYVLEVLMDLVRRGHEAPETRNVQLNPARADQARVKTADRWEVRELGVVARLLFEAVSRAMRKSTLSEAERQKLESDVQDALAFAWQLYEGAPAEYAQKAQKPLAAHLVNMVPPTVVPSQDLMRQKSSEVARG